jgi:RNA polymerase sigma-70 factor (ECF subfamily)
MMTTQSSTSPESLLDRARDGDREALGCLLDRYRSYLRLLARSLVSPAFRGRLDQSDLIQEAFLNAHLGFDQFQGASESELVAWLRAILARVLSNQATRMQVQSRDHRREVSLEALLDHSHDQLRHALAAPGSTPSEQESRREEAVRVADALDRLSPDQREVVILRLVDHVPIKEIAARTGRDVHAVHSLWTRALKRLNNILKEPS